MLVNVKAVYKNYHNIHNYIIKLRNVLNLSILCMVTGTPNGY